MIQLTPQERDLINRLNRISEAEIAAGARRFMSQKPERWYDAQKWRCINDHVSTTYLKSEAKGGACCMACGEWVWLTFPEDKDGPLQEGAKDGS